MIAKIIDYARPETIVDALKGQDALVITLNTQAPPETELSLVKAAGAAGVKWIMPNDWAPDSTDPDVVKDIVIFQPKGEYCALGPRILDNISCSCAPQGDFRARSEPLHQSGNGLLVRVESGHSGSLWH